MIDISFKNRTGQKPDILSAVIGADSFFYGLFTSDSQLLESGFHHIESFIDESTIAKVKNDIYSTEGLQIKVSYSGKPYLHIDRAHAGSLLPFFPAFKNKNLQSDKLTDQEILVDYGISKQHAHFLDEVLGRSDAKFHISTVLANYYYPYSTDKLVAMIDEDTVHIMYAKDQHFAYYNQFHCTNENDFLYFIMLAYQEMKLEPDSIPLEISGKVDSSSPIYDKLLGYVRNVDFVRSSKLDVKDLRYKDKQHYYLDLFATSICV